MQWFWNGRIHVPVPAGAALIVIAAATWIYFAKPPATARPPVGNAIAQPSTPAVSPAVSPATPAAAPPVEQVAPAASNVDRGETAALSGFRPVIQLNRKSSGSTNENINVYCSYSVFRLDGRHGGEAC